MRRDQTSGQIGEALGLAAATVQKYARERRIPFDATPGGHRRFALEEVRGALFGASPGLRAEPLPRDGGLGTGEVTSPSASALRVRETRATVLGADVPATSVGQRAGWDAHDDFVERDVLAPAGERIRRLAASHRRADAPTDVMRLVAATEEWYVEADERTVKLHAVLTEGSAVSAGLWDDTLGDWAHERIARATEQLRRDLAKRIPAQSGYALAVNPTTLDRVAASQYLSWAVWTLEDTDPL